VRQGGSVVITGASRGLGAALARRLAGPGVTLGLVARDGVALEAVAAACRAAGAEVRCALVDVRDAPAMREVLLRWDAEVPVTLAIANAGIAAGTRPDGAAEGLEAFRAQIDVNLMGAVHLVEALMPGMRGRGRGRFVLVSSVAAFRGLPDSPGYCASKAALWGYGEAVRAGLAGSGVGMTLVAPGFFDSAMGERWVGARPFSVSAEVAAGKIMRGAERGAAVVAFPWVLAWALRLSVLAPAKWVDAAVRRMVFRIRAERHSANG
jgi:short-subunit dehydrogenase